MHPSSVFHTDESIAREIVRRNPLATIAANGEQGPTIAIVPLVWNEDEACLIGHVGRQNALWTGLQGQASSVSAVFRSADAYVSASAYPSKAEHGRVVPTWNYIAAEIRGVLTFKTKLEDIRESVSRLSDQMEAPRSSPWAVSDAPPSYIDRLANAVVAFEIKVRELKGVRKLSQNKSDADRVGVVADLKKQNSDAERVAYEMNLENRA
ncbi:MAG: FMN-binding negative transcriptional regulator [Pseudomonadota bacterium]